MILYQQTNRIHVVQSYGYITNDMHTFNKWINDQYINKLFEGGGMDIYLNENMFDESLNLTELSVRNDSFFSKHQLIYIQIFDVNGFYAALAENCFNCRSLIRMYN
jgi:hypothetical protein